MSELQAIRATIARLNSGKLANEDSWMTMWNGTNWGDLLQPAPLSLALLGTIMTVASNLDDFSLQKPNSSHKCGSPNIPGSFKACLMQMVNEGYTAFGTAHKSMNRIHNASAQLPETIRAAVGTIVRGTPEEIKVLLPGQIEAIVNLIQICVSATKESEDAYDGIQNLASELAMACTHQTDAERPIPVGQAQQELQLAMSEAKAKSEEELSRISKDAQKRMMESFKTAEENFRAAAQSVPAGWDLVGMQFVESLTHSATSTGNALIAAAQLKQKSTHVEAHMANNADPASSNHIDVSDGGLAEAARVLQVVNALQLLLSGGPDGTLDWDTLNKNASKYLEGSLSVIKARLDPSKSISAQLIPVVDAALVIAKRVVSDFRTPSTVDNDIVAKYRSEIGALVTKAQQIVTKANLVCQQPGTVGTGPATPATPSKASKSAEQIALDDAKFQVDQLRANLQALRDAYDASTSILIRRQQQINQTVDNLISLSMTDAGMKIIGPALKKAVGAYTTSRAQLAQIRHMLECVGTMLTDVLLPAAKNIQTGNNNTESLAGLNFEAIARQILYSQLMLPHKVGTLVQKISTAYLDLSNKYIMPAQRSVGSILQFPDDNSAEGRAKLRASLIEKQFELKQLLNNANAHIIDLAEADRKEFVDAITQRLQSIQDALKDILPGVTEPVPKDIQDVANAHVKSLTEAREKALSNNPMFKTHTVDVGVEV